LIKYVCSVCGYIYDEEVGDPAKGIVPGTKWEDISADWSCPLCGAVKTDFIEEQSKKQINIEVAINSIDYARVNRKLSFGEQSALFSNLSKGCEKQYWNDAAESFHQLAEYYKSKNILAEQVSFSDFEMLIQQDLINYGEAKIIAAQMKDRGALRALTWGEKVTRLLKTILDMYEKQQDALLINKHIYVCEICGFIYIGNGVPEICPICKVPNSKIKEIKGR